MQKSKPKEHVARVKVYMLFFVGRNSGTGAETEQTEQNGAKQCRNSETSLS